MKSKIKQQVLDYINKNSKARPEDLRRFFGISSVTVHKHLKSLLNTGKVQRHGKPPLVFYTLPPSKPLKSPLNESDLAKEVQAVIKEKYAYISPTGNILYGMEGFKEWVVQVKQEKQFIFLANEYVEIRNQADSFFKKRKKYIEAIDKLKSTFNKVFLEKVFYQDFYSLPKFEKTKLGAFVLYGKQSQNIRLIENIGKECKPIILSIMENYSIDCIGWIPHSIPRKVPFLKELEKDLNFSLSTIDIVKAYSGEFPVAQKSLSKLEERITNARNTFFIKKIPSDSQRILLIDDALGSGATINEVAKKIQFSNPNSKIFGFTIVGSYKGFEVIKEA